MKTLHGWTVAAALTLASTALGATFTDKANGFSVTPPAGWNRGNVQGVAVIYGSPTKVDGFTPNVNVAVETLPGTISLTEYGRAGDVQFVKAIPGAKKVSSVRSTLGGYPAISQVYTGTVQGHALYFTQTFAVVGKRAYVLTGTTTPARASMLAPQMAAFVKSFRVLR
ncbi:PsbP-related protein [Deinococcus ruber]|uniref:PsbP C-terminal domain-containing protein n=1 Tax=Deinococcus ruber TaxID=1848197 RepID=A0A918BVP6_9DEIO|nr:PsbP-related protein [Deinococcus ruber]GGQ94540.1 hypothetical protein GCM10008957_03370 [Deinococcus ruber]